MVTRLLVRGLPKYFDNERFRKYAEEILQMTRTNIKLTDCRVVYDKFNRKRSREFGFLGFSTEKECKQALERFKGTYADTKKIEVEIAKSVGDPSLGKTWKQKHEEFRIRDLPEYADKVKKKNELKLEKKKDQDQEKGTKESDTKKPKKPKKGFADSNIEVAAETGRILVLNLPYNSTEADVRQIFQKAGPLQELHFVKTKEGKFSGRAFAQYVFPSHAKEAVEKLHLKNVGGRLLTAHGAHENEFEKEKSKKIGSNAKSSYKKQKAQELKSEAGDSKLWNILFVEANAAVEAVVPDLATTKEEFLDVNKTGSMAARVALAETKVIDDNRKWLIDEGMNEKLFEELTDLRKLKRSDDCIIVKHLDRNFHISELQELMSQKGPLVRFTVSPSRTAAIVQYLESSQAKKAFDAFCYKRFGKHPLYLEWAPQDLFLEEKPDKILPPPGVSKPTPAVKEELEEKGDMEDTEDKEEMSATSVLLPTVYVTNLSFETTEDRFMEFVNSHFEGKPPVVDVSFPKRKRAKDSKLLPSGYGFVQCSNREQANEIIERLQGVLLDGHALTFKQSQPKPFKKTKKLEELEIEVNVPKILVKNLSFEASSKDLKELFSAFGEVSSVRVPKKADGTSRGFAFVEMLTKKDTQEAMRSLYHTHLYGRRLILELANSEEVANKKLKTEK